MDKFTFNQKLLFTFIFTFYFLSSLTAQDTSKLYGTVFSQETGELISQAEVILNPGNQGTTTNSKGSFTFTGLNPGNYEIEVNHLGCKDYKAKIRLGTGEEKNLEIFVREKFLLGKRD